MRLLSFHAPRLSGGASRTGYGSRRKRDGKCQRIQQELCEPQAAKTEASVPYQRTCFRDGDGSQPDIRTLSKLRFRKRAAAL